MVKHIFYILKFYLKPVDFNYEQSKCQNPKFSYSDIIFYFKFIKFIFHEKNFEKVLNNCVYKILNDSFFNKKHI